MGRNPEFNGWQDDFSDDEWNDLGPDLDIEAERAAFAGESLRTYLEQDTPDRPWQKVAKRQLNPNLIGTLMGVATAATLVLGVVISNDPSSLVTDAPGLAATGVVGASTAIGAATSKIVRDANAEELNKVRRAERRQRREEDKW